jgi:hypothetical protein
MLSLAISSLSLSPSGRCSSPSPTCRQIQDESHPFYAVPASIPLSAICLDRFFVSIAPNPRDESVDRYPVSPLSPP